MRLLKFQEQLHPEASKVYKFDFSELLTGLSDTLTGTPTVTIVDPSPAPTGLTLSDVNIADANLSVTFKADVEPANEEDDTWRAGGVTVCVQCNAATAGGEDLVQQAVLVVTDECQT